MCTLSLSLWQTWLQVNDSTPLPFSAAAAAFDRNTATTWFAGPVPLSADGKSAKFSVTVKMKEKFVFEEAAYFNYGAASPIPTMLDPQWINAYYSEDGITWEDENVGHTFPVQNAGKDVKQFYVFLKSTNANYWKFVFTKTKYLDQGLAVPEIDFTAHVSSLYYTL
jgi:hypothetical protein